MSTLDSDDLARLEALILAHMHADEDSDEGHTVRTRIRPTKKARIRHWIHRGGLMMVVAGVGMGLHYFIEETHVYAVAQVSELSLSAMYAFVFEKVKSYT